jgi:5-methylcytosine-specific restriction protein B
VNSAPSVFHLTDAQTERLLACRAAWEEGEGEERLERLRQREEDQETLRAIARLLADSGFAQGNDIPFAELSRWLTLVRALAPNPNLDARLLRQPGEPENLNRDLRDLLFGPAPSPLRLRSFLTRRHAGGQTALQLLCAAFPTDWPLITRAGLNALELSPEQRAEALEAARVHFDLPNPADSPSAPAEHAGAEAETPPASGGPQPSALPSNDPVLRLLAEVVVYRAVRSVLETDDYVAVHRLLTQGMTGRYRRARRAPAPALYPSPEAQRSPGTLVREPGSQDYDAPTSPQEPSAPLGAPPDIAGASAQELLRFLESYVAAQGFTYPARTLRDYYISLQTKPYVWLVGSSGIGKTRLTSLFAEALTAHADAQYRLLAVRPDWADSTPLLGYVNLLAGGGEGRFVSTPFLDFLRRAARPENAYRAFFLCLDEMNLARVEHYFAEILSAMETPTRELLLPNGSALRLPANLFITGTLNTDEATHALSRKVLDRANTLAFQEVRLRESEASAALPDTAQEERLSPEIRQALFLQRRVTTVAAARVRLRQVGGDSGDFAARVVNALADANDLLQPHGLHFAYRVRDEILRYCANSFDANGSGLLVPEDPADREANLRIALDLQLLQKVLPRLTGTREQLDTPIRALLAWAQKAVFPQTAAKLSRMLARLDRDGFVTFDEI